MDFDNTDRGALFRNERKQKETQPEYTGQLNVGGVEYWLSAWVKTSKTGKKFFSLSVQEKQEKATSGHTPSSEPRHQADEPLDDDIPF